MNDCAAVLALDPTNTIAGIVRASALYALHWYDDALAQLSKLDRKGGVGDVRLSLEKRLEKRMREEEGEWDWGHVILEAEAMKWKGLDRASWIGGVEIRERVGVGGGRGLFAKKDLKAGDLLLVEKAMGVAVPKPAIGGKERRVQDLQDLHGQLGRTSMKKLRGNRKEREGFVGLYAGADPGEEGMTTEGICGDVGAVRRRLNYNSFAFEWMTRDQHMTFLREGGNIKTERENPNCCIGVWKTASCANHSCLPNAQRAFLGDLIVFRASRYMTKDEEVTISYIPLLESLAERTRWFKDFGFVCQCAHCTLQRAEDPNVAKTRVDMLAEIEARFANAERIEIMAFEAALDRLEESYKSDSSVVPRYSLNFPISSIIGALHGPGLEKSCFDLGMRLLRGLGWEIVVTNKVFVVKRFGVVADEVLFVMANMWSALGSLKPKTVVEHFEVVLRRAHMILIGEPVSFAAAYARYEPDIREGDGDLGGEDPDMVEIAEELLGKMTMTT